MVRFENITGNRLIGYNQQQGQYYIDLFVMRRLPFKWEKDPFSKVNFSKQANSHFIFNMITICKHESANLIKRSKSQHL